MKIKIIQTKTVLKEVEFPMYCCVNGEFELEYVKIELDKMTCIKPQTFGFEIWIHEGDNTQIANVWYNNQCPKEEWDTTLKATKIFLNKIE